MPDVYQRLVKLRDQWLEALELEVINGMKPSYEQDETRIEWSAWRLDMIRSIREACAILREAGPNAR